jgi:hypothetical protein
MPTPRDGDPRHELDRLFGGGEEKPPSPFPDVDPAAPPRTRLDSAISRIRRLRGQVGAEGLTSAGTRSLLDELAQALEAIREELDTLRGSRSEGPNPPETR